MKRFRDYVKSDIMFWLKCVMNVRRSKALLTNTSIIVLCFLIKFMRDRKDSRNLPFYIRSEILKNRKEMLREMRKSVKLKESKKKQL